MEINNMPELNRKFKNLFALINSFIHPDKTVFINDILIKKNRYNFAKSKRRYVYLSKS